MPPRLTDYELETLAAQPAGTCDLIVNQQHYTRIVQGGIAKAAISLDILTADFKSMLVPLTSAGRKSNRARSIIQLFRFLAQKGVEIRILHAGTPSGPALVELKKISAEENARLTIRRCPRLHAKAVIIDARAMYLGSANLTGAGLGAKGVDKRNFEMGVWTQAPPLIEAVLEQFNMLWEGHRCKKCRRKDVCPVPLEEPEL
jgi:phosphatidylserine/phosphatidylglycerophosphate/cardiolipin synthase-like enzyme